MEGHLQLPKHTDTLSHTPTTLRDVYKHTTARLGLNGGTDRGTITAKRNACQSPSCLKDHLWLKNMPGKPQAASTRSDQSSAEQRGEEEGNPRAGLRAQERPHLVPGWARGVLGGGGSLIRKETWQRERIKGLHPTLLSPNSATLAVPCRSHHVSPSWG